VLPRIERRRRERLAERPAPDAWRVLLAREVPLLRQMPESLRQRLTGLMQVFLAEKTFVGCNGLEVSDTMRLVIAAQACALVLERPGVPSAGLYPALRSILVYPAEFLVHEQHEDEHGLVTEGHRSLSGQAWDASRIILSWADVTDSGDGYNVVLHEFAHYLDVEDDITTDGFERTDGREHAAWQDDLRREYERLAADIDAGRDTFLDPYAASEPAEFFAVATEAFFDVPRELVLHHPVLYARLAEYYRLDPARWTAASNS